MSKIKQPKYVQFFSGFASLPQQIIRTYNIFSEIMNKEEKQLWKMKIDPFSIKTTIHLFIFFTAYFHREIFIF